MPDSSDAWTSYQWLGLICFSLSGCLSASSLNFCSLDYQQCNWVRELCGPVTAAQARFCWNPSKLTAELRKVNKTTGAKLVLEMCDIDSKTTNNNVNQCVSFLPLSFESV